MLATPSGMIIMPSAAFPPATFSIIQFILLLSVILAIPAGMDHQDAEIVEVAVAASNFFLLIDVSDHRQSSSAESHTDAAFVRDHRKESRCGCQNRCNSITMVQQVKNRRCCR